MKLKEARNKIEQAQALIFDIEKSLPEREYLRTRGYQCRVFLGEYYNSLNIEKEEFEKLSK